MMIFQCSLFSTFRKMYHSRPLQTGKDKRSPPEKDTLCFVARPTERGAGKPETANVILGGIGSINVFIAITYQV
jgi:hypothetical protein